MEENPLKFDAAKKAEEITEGIKRSFQEKGFSKAILGLSGGVDSSVAAFLLVRALGKKNVEGLIMPYKDQDTLHAEEVADILDIKTERIDISPMVDAYFSNFPDADNLRRGNKMARERMSILFDRSHKTGALVVGTGNRTELELGYFTMYGDGACAVAPLASLYKTQVFELARHLEVPEDIVGKAPSAGLWEGQTDEGELGATYLEMDRILCYIDEGLSTEDITNKGLKESAVKMVRERKRKNRYKLEGPVFL